MTAVEGGEMTLNRSSGVPPLARQEGGGER